MSTEIDWDNGDITQPPGTSQPSSSQPDWDNGQISPPVPARGFSGWARDIAATAVKGAIAVPEAVVGLADIPTGGRVGKFLENEGGAFGFRPKQAKEAVNDWHSDATKEAQRKFQEAEGIGGKFKAAIENPSTIVTAVGESIPSMLAGGVAARGLMAATKLGQMGAKGAALAGAAGEGITAAGSAAEQIRQETPDGLLTPTQAGLAAGTGVATAGFGVLGGRVANKLGIGDVDTMIAQGGKGMADEAGSAAARAAANPLVQQQAMKGIPRRVIEGAISEGFLEELPQSVAEQVFQNVALGKDWLQDVDAAAVMGVLSGGVMGGAASGYHGMRQPAPRADGLRPPEQPPAQPGQPAPEVVQDQPNPALQRIRQAYAEQLAALQAQELGEPGVPQTAPPDGAAVLAQQQAEEAARRQAAQEASRSVASQDDEIYQSTGATVPLSVRMGLDPAAGPLSAGAALAVDTGASEQMQQAAAQAQAAEQTAKDGKKPAAATQKQEQPAQSLQGVDQDTGEIPQGNHMAAWSDADLSSAFRGAQSRDVRMQLARELSRRRAEREQQALQAELDAEQAGTVPGAERADAAFASLSEDAGPVPDDLSIPTTIKGNTDVPQADQAQQAAAQPAQAGPAQPAQGLTDGSPTANHGAQGTPAPGAQGTASAQKAAGREGYDTPVELDAARLKAIIEQTRGAPLVDKPAKLEAWRNGTAQTDAAKFPIELSFTPDGRLDVNDGRHRIALAAERGEKVTAFIDGKDAQRAQVLASQYGNAQTQAQQAQAATESGAQVETREQRAQRVARAGEVWTRMPTVERQALAARAAGLNPIQRKNVPKSTWANLNASIQRGLADAMAPAAAPAIAPLEPVDSLHNPGKPDPKNSAAMDELEGFKPGEAVEVQGRTIGPSTVELVFRRQMAGLGVQPMARVVGANGKKLDVLLSELTRTEQKADEPAPKSNRNQAPALTKQAQASTKTEAISGVDGSDKTRWLKSVADMNRMSGQFGAQIDGVANGRLSVVGNPNATKQGRALMAAVDEARRAGATNEEIAAAATTAQPIAQPQAALATHADPGQAPEPATPAVVAQSVQKAARNEDVKPSAMRAWVLAEIDKAMLDAPEKDATEFVSFDVPGDGTFKVQKSRERLQAFRKQVQASPGFKDGGQRQNTQPPEQTDSARNGSGSTVEAIRNFLADGDVQGAVEFAKLKGVEFTPVEPRASMTANGKFKRVPASVKSSVPSVADGLTQVEAEQINQYLTAEQARAEPADAQDADVQPSPQDFIPAPDGGLDYGEITPEMGKAMRRQAGKIRLQHGVQNSNGTGWGLVHIEANHGKQISGLGFGSVQDFVAHVASSIQQVWQVPGNSQLLLTLKDGRKDVMYIQLEIVKEGDFYRVNSAFPVRQEDYESLKGMKKIWDGSEPTSAVTGQRPAFATAASASPESESSQGSSNARGQDASVPPTAPEAQPITRADVTAAQQQARDMIAQAIDAMSAGELNKIAKRFLPTMGLKPTISKERNKAAMLDQQVNLQAAADELGAILPADVKRALQADMEGRVADAGQDDGVTPRPAVAKQEPGKPIEDAGEKIGGARKDRWKERGLNLDDLDAMTEAEGAELATKANVWKPDYDALAEASEPVTAAMVKTIYDQLAAKPKKNTPEGRRQYVQMMRIVRDVLTEAKGPDAVRNAYLEIRKRAGLNTMDTEAKEVARGLLFSVYKGRSDPFVLGGADLMKAKKMVEDGFPAKAAPWKSRLTVGRREGGNGVTERGIEMYMELSADVGTPLSREQIEAGFFRVVDKQNKTVAFAPTKEDAEAAAETVYERDLKGKKDSKPEPVRPNLDELKRENLPRRIDRDVTADDFVKDLGFRGIEFGNWSAQDERQRILNMAYDGLMDLAEIMGVPPKAMSLNGTLGMAFGARGGGRFAAHYEPGKLVINMTKIRGGGSMAHEWAHALDHYFGELDKADAYTTQARGASGWYAEDQYVGVPRKRMERVGNEWKSVEKMRLDNLRPEMAAAFDEVMRALFSKQITKAEMVRSHELDLERTEALARNETQADLKAMYQNMAQNKRQALNELRGDPEGTMYAGRGRTEYANQAQALSGKSVDGYWVRPTEMFARAFESWVFDRVTAMGARSDYLVHGVEEDRFAGGAYKGNPYPTGEERARINAAFDKLAQTIKTKKTGQGVAMFSRAQPAIRSAAAAMEEASRRADALYDAEPGTVTAEEFSAVGDARLAAESAMLDALAQLPDSGFAVEARTSDGRMLIVTPSASEQGRWQLTRFGKDGEPWGDTRFDTKHQALQYLVDEAVPSSIKPAGAAMSRAVQPLRTPAATPPADSNARNVATQLLIDGLKAKWTRAPEIIVARNMQDAQIPQEVRDYDALLKSQGATGEPRGFIYKGKVYLLSDQLKGPEQIAEVLFHEVLGHYGLRGAFGDSLNSILQQMGTMRRKDVVAKAREYGLFNKDALGGLDKAAASDSQIWAAMSAKDRLSAAEEVLAEMAQTQPNIGFVQRAIAAIRNWLRANVPGFKNLKLTDADIVQAYILPARGYVTRSQETAQQAIDRAMTDAGFSRTAGDQTQTENFRRWFAGSKVVESGLEELLSKPDGVGVLLRDLLAAQNATGSGLNPVQALMLALAKNDKIGRGIVGLVPVDVVNSFSKDDLRPKDGGGNTSMFVNALNAPVSDQVLSTFRGILTSLSTKLANAIATGRDQEIAPALLASDFNLREVGGLLSLQGSTDFWGGNTGVKSVSAGEAAKSTSPGLGSPAKDFKLDATALADLFNKFVSFAPHAKTSTSDDLPSAKYIAKQGKPLVVYHGTTAEISAFQQNKAAEKDAGWYGRGIYFTADPDTASTYSRYEELQGKELSGAPRVMPVYVSIQNPYVWPANRRAATTPEEAAAIRKELEAQGHDGVIVPNEYADPRYAGHYEVVAFHPEQVKSAIGNNGNFDPNDPDIRFSRTKLNDLKASAIDQLHQTLSHPGKVSLWDKTVGTMRHLAERNPAFKPVFEAAQRFIDDVSMLGNDAADRAPRLLPRVETLADLKKKPITPADNKAVGKPLFEGTLLWARDVDGRPMLVDEMATKYANLPADDKARLLLRSQRIDPGVLEMWQGLPVEQYESAINSRFDSKMLRPGVVWSANELKSMFGLTDGQVSLYREARMAIDRSIDMTARADMLRLLGDQYAPMRDAVLEAESMQDALTLLVDTLEQEAQSDPEMRERLADLMHRLRQRHDDASELMKQGYTPLSRFGKYTVDVVDANGERQYFGMFESMREANQMAMRMRDVFKGAAVTQGTMSDEAYKLFQGITPESLEQFGNMLGLDSQGDSAQDKAFQAYLQLAKNNHSALKRLIHRKGIAGYSEDVGRVLASFVYSNARLAAGGLNAGTLEKAIEAIPKEQGELRDVAMGLRSYIQDPQEEGQAVRGMLFAQYLGGSVASAFVNMTQPFQITMPWLSQFGGMRKAAGQMARALKDMGTKGFKYEPDLEKALQDAVADGTVAPQEIHQLMAQARGTGSLRTGDGTRIGDVRAAAANNLERVKVAWGQPFALAEQFNRRSTFIAAYRMAKEQGMTAPAEFARRAVLETQFVYSRANKMRWGRGAIGGTMMTFKTYSVSYLELMQRMWTQGGPEGKRAVAWAVAMLMLMGGAGGLPFMEDLEDLIDGAGQLMGYNISTKQWRKQLLRDTIGKELGDFVEQGVSGLPGAPIDVSGRLGMGNLLPGTGLLLSKQNRERDLMEVVGPAGDLVARGFTGARKALTGDLAGAALDVSPTAVRNAAKGLDMATSGIYKDAKGYKVIDVTMDEAIAKAIGFQPRSVAEVQESNSFMQRSKSFYIQTSNDIKAQWAQALFNKDDAALERVRERLADWNRDNPDQPIVVKMPDVWKRVREMGKDRTQRIADTAPKALRQQMREMARENG